jgi:ankyrin repeat protein
MKSRPFKFYQICILLGVGAFWQCQCKNDQIKTKSTQKPISLIPLEKDFKPNPKSDDGTDAEEADDYKEPQVDNTAPHFPKSTPPSIKNLNRSELEDLQASSTYGEKKFLWDMVQNLLKHPETTNINRKNPAQNNTTALHQAVRHASTSFGSMKVLSGLIEGGADINVRNGAGETALHQAANLKDIKIAKFLLENGASINIKNQKGETPLHIAARHGNKELMKILLAKDSSMIDARNKFGYTALHIAAWNGDVPIAKLLLEQGAETKLKTKDGNTALHLAALRGHFELCQELVDRKAPVNVINKEGKKAVELTDHPKIIQLLGRKPQASKTIDDAMIQASIAAGKPLLASILTELKNTPNQVDVNRPDPSDLDNTALHQAAELEDQDILKILLEKGAKVNAVNSQAETPLYIAAIKGHIKAVKILLSNQALVEFPLGAGLTPLQGAANNGHLEVVKALVQAGVADTDKNYTYSAINLASEEGHTEIVKFLLQNGVSANDQDSSGHTPLYMAAAKGRLSVVQVLLDNHAQVNIVSSLGYTPLHAAVNNGHLEVVKALIQAGADPFIKDPAGKTSIETTRNKEIKNILIKGKQP